MQLRTGQYVLCQNIHACPVAMQWKTDITTYSTYTAHMNGCIHVCIHSLAQSLKHQAKWKEACGCCHGDQQKRDKTSLVSEGRSSVKRSVRATVLSAHRGRHIKKTFISFLLLHTNPQAHCLCAIRSSSNPPPKWHFNSCVKEKEKKTVLNVSTLTSLILCIKASEWFCKWVKITALDFTAIIFN